MLGKLLSHSELTIPTSKDCCEDEKNKYEMSVAMLAQSGNPNDSYTHSFIYSVSRSQLHCHSVLIYYPLS